MFKSETHKNAIEQTNVQSRPFSKDGKSRKRESHVMIRQQDGHGNGTNAESAVRFCFQGKKILIFGIFFNSLGKFFVSYGDNSEFFGNGFNMIKI